jgi:hypothetical protein
MRQGVSEVFHDSALPAELFSHGGGIWFVKHFRLDDQQPIAADKDKIGGVALGRWISFEPGTVFFGEYRLEEVVFGEKLYPRTAAIVVSAEGFNVQTAQGEEAMQLGESVAADQHRQHSPGVVTLLAVQRQPVGTGAIDGIAIHRLNVAGSQSGAIDTCASDVLRHRPHHVGKVPHDGFRCLGDPALQLTCVENSNIGATRSITALAL